MSRYAAYPDYIETRLAWARKIPVGWEVKKITHAISYSVGFTPESGNPLYYGEEYDWANISDLGSKILLETKKHITAEAVKHYAKKPAKKGSLLYSFKLSVGQVSFAGKEMYTNEAIAAFAESDLLKLSYLYYLSPLAILQNASENIYGAKILNQEAIGNAKVLIPPLSEQAAIAGFLDYKTAQIDALIAKKETLLARLAEKRTALISHAVTKGLDPAVPMKDSGVAWLGDIPAHWKRMLLARVILRIEQGWSPSCDDRQASLDEWGVLKSGCVNNGVFRESEHKTLPINVDPILTLEVRPGDVLMCRASGSRHLIGSVALVWDCREKLLFSDKTYRISFHRRMMSPTFFVLVMLAKYMRDQIELSISGADGLANNIPQSSVKAYVLIVPPLAEQERIVTNLNELLKKSRQQEAKIFQAIEKLKEYRYALITNAVTGKIDVRNFKVPENA